MHQSEYSIDMVVQEILLYIADINFAEIGLQAMERDLEMCHNVSNGYPPETGRVLAKASTILGRKLVQRFIDIGAYLSDGTLPFEMFKWIRTSSYAPTPVLRKCLDYVAVI